MIRCDGKLFYVEDVLIPFQNEKSDDVSYVKRGILDKRCKFAKEDVIKIKADNDVIKAICKFITEDIIEEKYTTNEDFLRYLAYLGILNWEKRVKYYKDVKKEEDKIWALLEKTLGRKSISDFRTATEESLFMIKTEGKYDSKQYFEKVKAIAEEIDTYGTLEDLDLKLMEDVPFILSYAAKFIDYEWK